MAARTLAPPPRAGFLGVVQRNKNKKKRKRLTGGETTHVKKPAIVLDGQEDDTVPTAYLKTLETATSHYRKAEMGSVDFDTQKQFASHRNRATYTIIVAGQKKNSLTKGIFTVERRDAGFPLFSSGDGKEANAFVHPQIDELGYNTRKIVRVKRKKVQPQMTALTTTLGGLEPRMYIASDQAIKANYQALVNADMDKTRGGATSKFSDSAHRHSEQVVVIDFKSEDSWIADKIDDLDLTSIESFAILMHSEREMCNHCSNILNHLITHPKEFPITWKKLKDLKITYFPTIEVGSRIAFNANRNIPLGSSATGHLTTTWGTNGEPMYVDTMVGATGFHLKNSSDPMESLVRATPPTLNQLANVGAVDTTALMEMFHT
jgi:hypothetical protein